MGTQLCVWVCTCVWFVCSAVGVESKCSQVGDLGFNNRWMVTRKREGHRQRPREREKQKHRDRQGGNECKRKKDAGLVIWQTTEQRRGVWYRKWENQKEQKGGEAGKLNNSALENNWQRKCCDFKKKGMRGWWIDRWLIRKNETEGKGEERENVRSERGEWLAGRASLAYWWRTCLTHTHTHTNRNPHTRIVSVALQKGWSYW